MTWQDFLLTQNARFSDGVLTDFGDAQQEMLCAQNGTILTPLMSLASLDVTGQEAAPFLHRQLTSHVESLAHNTFQRSAWCSHKGRVIADVLLLHHTQGFRAYVADDLQETVLKKLSMYVLRSKVAISKPQDERVLLGLSGQETRYLLEKAGFEVPEPMQITEKDGTLLICLSSERLILDATAEQAILYWSLWSKAATPAGNNAWDAKDLQDGIAHITQATSEAFVPQMLHFDHLGHVHFQKGCYPGQEVIMRARHLGKIKRHLYLLVCDAPAEPGSLISSGTQENIGQIVSTVKCAQSQALSQAVLSEDFANTALTIHTKEPVRLLQKPAPFFPPHPSFQK